MRAYFREFLHDVPATALAKLMGLIDKQQTSGGTNKTDNESRFLLSQVNGPCSIGIFFFFFFFSYLRFKVHMVQSPSL